MSKTEAKKLINKQNNESMQTNNQRNTRNKQKRITSSKRRYITRLSDITKIFTYERNRGRQKLQNQNGIGGLYVVHSISFQPSFCTSI